MSKRVKQWARVRLERLRQMLGGRCAVCGGTHNLEFDCIRPAGHAHHGMSTDGRATFYWQQMRLGNVQLLCGETNAWKGDMSEVEWITALNKMRERIAAYTTIKPSEYCEYLRNPLSPRGNGA